MKTSAFLVSLVVVSFSASSLATEAEMPCIDCGVTENKPVNSLKSFAQALNSGNTHWIDGYFYADTKVVGKELDVTFKNPKDLELSQSSQSKVNSAYLAFLSQKSLNDAVAYAHKSGVSFNHEEKLLLLSMIGSRLSAGYSATGTENKNLEAVYQNAVRQQKEGGICGDIHRVLGEVAKSLGFEAVGHHNGQWQQNLDKDKVGGHAILHFRDPKTGEYYVQNYSQLYNTKQKTLQSAVDVSSKILGVLTGTQYVESRPGKVHEYVPATSQWVQESIKGVALFKPDQSAFTVRASNNEQTIAVQMGTKTVKGFMLGTQVRTDEGTYRLEAAGLSARTGASIISDGKLIDEVKVTAETYGGALRLTAPGFDRMTNTFKDGERSTLFFGSDLKGSARINNTTGKVELSTSTFDFKPKSGDQDKNTTSGVRTELKAGVEHEWKELNLKASADRTWSFMPVQLEQKHQREFQTTYDRVGVIYDTSKPDKKEAYLVVGADVYFLEGVNTSSAIAVRNSIKAVLPTEKLGTFSVSADLGRIVDNKSKDPFYDIKPASSVSVEWTKKLNKMFELGANVSHTRGNQITPFGVIGPVSPVMGTTQNKVQGMVFLHGKF
ncbi:hypothetical protein ACLWBD_10325 [Bdellovibrio sp. HCB117]|uniref:hypothetical protein n=1 Tax=Bdellovibrio sp. HCB117 TaxID=3394359 RepID=UPI0039B584AF